jgi:hypothetical protein
MTKANAISGLGPRVVSMRCHAAEPGAHFSWHSHPFEELTFVSDDGATIGCPLGHLPVAQNTLLLYRRGEAHAAWCGQAERPNFWVVHFAAGRTLTRVMSRMFTAPFRKRFWGLTPEQAEAFKSYFLRLQAERMQPRKLAEAAESAWLQLLLVSAGRWASGPDAPAPPSWIKPELQRLWQQVNAAVGKPAKDQRQVLHLPNYDSLRHGFRQVFGCSPRRMLLRLRMQHAKNLLLDSPLSIKEVAARCGYARQHEFTRAFRQHFGRAPSQWRASPFASRSISISAK